MAKRKTRKKEVNFDFTIKVGRKTFIFRESENLRDDVWGEAGQGVAEFHPKLRNKSPRFQAEYLMHESLHLLHPDWSEARVWKIANVLSRVLRKAKVV